MTHQRPIPEAAQSPYPLHPAPAPATVEDAGREEAGNDNRPNDDTAESGSKLAAMDPRSWGRREQIGLGAALGIGSAALLAALLYSRRGDSRSGERRQAA